MKHSKFVAVLLVIAFTFGSLSTAFAFNDNTKLENYTSARKETAKIGADTFITGVAAAASTETALTAVGSGAATAIAAATGVAVSPVVAGAVIVAGTAAIAVIAVNSFIDWIW